MLATKLITAPVLEPVDLESMRKELRVTNTSEDDLIVSKIKTARHMAEKFTESKFYTQTWEYYLECFPKDDELLIPHPPLQSITSIKYYDSANVLQTWDAVNYRVNTGSQPGSVEYVSSWPATYYRSEAIVIKFVCGYSSRELIPEPIKDAIKLMAAHLFENRQQVMVVTGTLNIAELPLGVYDLLTPYQVNVSYANR
jgi:uncharacterized phiE125 gp8 family phage protein